MTRIGGRYEMLGELGRGGMATVHLARQTDLDRLVALKELSGVASADSAAAARFLREARFAGSLSHPNVVTIHDFFAHDGTPFIAMEHVPGGTLRRYQGSLSPAQLFGVLLDVLAGLAHAERLGIVHRDLKPENLLVTADGRVKIADFGIARAIDRTRHATRLTATGTTIGTPDYIAPEQAMGGQTGPWSDLYSLGCIAFELLTGRPPFADADSSMAILLSHVNDRVPPVRSVDPAVDPQLADWVDRLVAREPEDRTRSAATAAAELEDLALETLGPRWRASAALAAELDEPPRATRPRTTAPFAPSLAATLPPTRRPTGPTAPLPADRTRPPGAPRAALGRRARGRGRGRVRAAHRDRRRARAHPRAERDHRGHHRPRRHAGDPRVYAAGVHTGAARRHRDAADREAEAPRAAAGLRRAGGRGHADADARPDADRHAGRGGPAQLRRRLRLGRSQRRRLRARGALSRALARGRVPADVRAIAPTRGVSDCGPPRAARAPRRGRARAPGRSGGRRRTPWPSTRR